MTPSIARGLVFGALALGLAPDPEITVAAWAQASRYVAAESSPFPGKWDNALVPYLVEPMECLSLSRPNREVIVKKSAQTGFTETGINLFGTVATRTPAPILIVLPTDIMVRGYVRTKLDPAIEATPSLRDKVATQKSRDESGSTITFKRFPGGYALVTGANSSAGLQMFSTRVLVLDEVSEYPFDLEGRGDPVDLAIKRTTAFTESRKVFYLSTPGIKGACRISAKFEESDQRRYYVPCPHCGTFQILTFANLRWDSETKPFGAHFVCASSGCIIEAHHRRSMVARGAWLKTFPGDAPGEVVAAEDLERHRARSSAGREPGFHIWQAYSPFVPWDDTVGEYLRARGNSLRLKVFTQQTLGEEWEEKGEAPDHERLFERREKYPARRVVPGCLFTTGATDVQGDRLEWAVYGWARDGDRSLAAWLIDVGVIAGDPSGDEVWKAHDAILSSRYEDAWGRHWPVDGWGIDAGYLSAKVYRYVRGHAASGKVFALDGRQGWKLPALGTPKTVDIDYAGRKIGAVQLWPVGTWDMKSEVYSGLRATIAGPDADGKWPEGAMHFFDRCDRDFFKQITAEHLADRATRTGFLVKEWVRQGRNEQLDLAVYARALAHHLSDHLTPARWAELTAERQGRPEDIQGDLAALWAPSLATGGALATQPAASSPPLAPAPAVDAALRRAAEYLSGG